MVQGQDYTVDEASLPGLNWISCKYECGVYKFKFKSFKEPK